MNNSEPNDDEALANEDERPEVIDPAAEATEPKGSAIAASIELGEVVSVSVEAGEGVDLALECYPVCDRGDRTFRPLLASLEAMERAADEALAADAGSLERLLVSTTSSLLASAVLWSFSKLSEGPG